MTQSLEPPIRKSKTRTNKWGATRYHGAMRRMCNPNSRSAKRKHGYCKRAKGPHEYGERVISHNFDWITGSVITRFIYYLQRCVACGKKRETSEEI